MRVLLFGFALLAVPAAAQLPPAGSVSSTVNGALDVRVDRPELNPPSAASVARRNADPVSVEADASVQVRRGQLCAWEGRAYPPVEREGGWYCERPRAVGAEGRSRR